MWAKKKKKKERHWQQLNKPSEVPYLFSWITAKVYDSCITQATSLTLPTWYLMTAFLF